MQTGGRGVDATVMLRNDLWILKRGCNSRCFHFVFHKPILLDVNADATSLRVSFFRFRPGSAQSFENSKYISNFMSKEARVEKL
jgi:hypothetical protein